MREYTYIIYAVECKTKRSRLWSFMEAFTRLKYAKQKISRAQSNWPHMEFRTVTYSRTEAA